MSLNISIGANGANDGSTFAVTEGESITLTNVADAKVTVAFSQHKSPLCSQTEPPRVTVDLSAGESRQYQACAVVLGQTYQYTATVGRTKTETASITVAPLFPEQFSGTETNPIIVIHREVTGENLFFGAAGLLVGVALAVLFKAFGRSSPRT
jgi:hypothetical protein